MADANFIPRPDGVTPGDFDGAAARLNGSAGRVVTLDGRQYIGADDPPGPTTQSVQAEAEDAVDVEAPDTIEFLGERFRIAANVSLMPLLAFANASKRGLDSDDMDGLAAMYALIRSVVDRPPLYGEDGKRLRDETSGQLLRDESEWQRFERLAEDECADGEDIMEAVNQALAVISARPPKRRGTSSATSPRTSGRSKGASSSPVTRPELDGMVPVAQLGR